MSKKSEGAGEQGPNPGQIIAIKEAQKSVNPQPHPWKRHGLKPIVKDSRRGRKRK